VMLGWDGDVYDRQIGVCSKLERKKENGLNGGMKYSVKA